MSQQQQKPVWVDMIRTLKVKDIVPLYRQTVTVNSNDNISVVFTKLSTHGVSYAVVLDNSNNVVGFVGVSDILTYVLQVLKKDQIKAQDLEGILERSEFFQIGEVWRLINISGDSKLFTIGMEDTLIDLMDIFAKEVHILAVLQDGNVINVVTQSDIILAFATGGAYLGSDMNIPIGRMNIGMTNVLKSQDVSAASALISMSECKVRAVPVVDNDGRLMATFSISDLKRLNKTNLPLLTLHITTYLKTLYGFPKPPVYATVTETLEHVILKLVVHGIHRIWVVDDQMHVLRVIAMTDIIQYFVNSQKLVPN